MTPDDRDDRMAGRAKRYARVGTGLGGVAARAVRNRITSNESTSLASDLRMALGDLKGPLMKVAQFMATIPDLLPEDFALELRELQANAPSMGWTFVRRRMRDELGADWQKKFRDFERQAAAAASLGQVHRATSLEGEALACKLQYPDMDSVVAADLAQLRIVMGVYRRISRVIDPVNFLDEISDRLHEELDYERERKHMALYADMLEPYDGIHVPAPLDDLSTRRLITMSWLEGRPLLEFTGEALAIRNAIATHLFHAWWHPFARFGVIHGDPHLGNYTVNPLNDAVNFNLMDFGCIRIFDADFVAGVVELYRALETDDLDRAAAAYRSWGFEDISGELIDTLNIWAKFIYGPMLDDRTRTIADGVAPAEYGRAEAMRVHEGLKAHGTVTPPREFVFMDRAAIGLGGVFLHLKAELNWHQFFNEAIQDFEADRIRLAQATALERAGLAGMNEE